MLVKQETKYATTKDYVNSLAIDNKLNLNYKSPSEISFDKIPASMDEARAYSNFWNGVISEFKSDVEKINFFYQENDKELPLSTGKKFLKSLGAKIKPKVQQGQVKYEKATPEFVRHVNSEKSLINIVADKNEWERLNAISKNTRDFSAPFVMLPENLCYQVMIPLECISGVSFNSNDFLNKDYENEVKQ